MSTSSFTLGALLLAACAAKPAPSTSPPPSSSPAAPTTPDDTSKLSTADREAVKGYQAKFSQQLDTANTQCGSKLKASYDVATEPAQRPTGEDAGAGYQWCGDILKGIAWHCEHHAEAKPAIAAKLEALKCSFDPGSGMRLMHDKNQYGPELKLAGKTLEASYDWNTANTFDETGKWLEHNL